MTEQQNPYQAPEAELMTSQSGEGALVLRDTPYSESIGAGWRWIKEGFGIFKQSPGAWIGGMIVVFLISLVLGFIPVIGQLASYIIGPIFAGGMMLGCRDQETGGQFRFNHFFDGFSNNTGQLAMVGVLYLVGIILAVIPGIIIMGTGMLELFVNPDSATALQNFDPMTFVLAVLVMMALMVPVMMAIWFAPALVVHHDLSAFAAMKKSFKGCLKNILPFLWYGIVVFLLSILAMIPLMLGLLVLMPAVAASTYAAYRGIFTEA